jgi:hypothetical protein
MALALSGYATDNSTENGHQMSSIVPVSCPLLPHYQTSPRLLKRAVNGIARLTVRDTFTRRRRDRFFWKKKNETADIEMHTIKSSCNWIFYLRFGANGNGYFRGAHSSSACVFQFSQRILNAFSSPIPGLFNSKCFHSRASVTIHGSWIPDDMRPALVDPIQLFKTGWTRIRHNQSVRFQRFRPKNFILPLFSLLI